MYHCILIAFLLNVLQVANAERTEIRGAIAIGKEERIAPLRLVLNGGEFNTFARHDGTFVFQDVPYGRYALDVLSEQYLFSQFKVDIQSDGTMRVLEYKYPGAEKQVAQYPIAINAHMPIQYFKQREKMGLGTILKNPSFFMMLITAVMVFVMPKMMANMDPEEMKKMQEDMNQNDPQKMLSNMFGGGGKKDEDDD